MIAVVRQIIKDAPLNPLHGHVELLRHADRIADRAAFLGALVDHQRFQPAPARAHRFNHRPVSVEEFRHQLALSDMQTGQRLCGGLAFGVLPLPDASGRGAGGGVDHMSQFSLQIVPSTRSSSMTPSAAS